MIKTSVVIIQCLWEYGNLPVCIKQTYLWDKAVFIPRPEKSWNMKLNQTKILVPNEDNISNHYMQRV